MDSGVVSALLGGSVIGFAIALMRATEGRIAGVSGMIGTCLMPATPDRGVRIAFLLGLALTGTLLAATGTLPAFAITHLPWRLVLGGLLVGFGTRLGHGCTSGHGICGTSRGSTRSIVATLVFMLTGFATLALEHVR